MILLYTGLGLLAGLAVVAYVQKGAAENRASRYALYLVLASLVYVAFGLIRGGLPLGIELVGLAAFAFLAWFGRRRWMPLLALGWLAHMGWDAIHFHDVLSNHAPDWYVGLCLGFDPVVAVAIFRSTPEWSGELSPPPSEPTTAH